MGTAFISDLVNLDSISRLVSRDDMLYEVAFSYHIEPVKIAYHLPHISFVHTNVFALVLI